MFNKRLTDFFINACCFKLLIYLILWSFILKNTQSPTTQGNLYGSLNHDSPVAEKINLPLECAHDKFVQVDMNPQGTHFLVLTDSGSN